MPTIPPDNVTAGQSGHVTHHNQISDVLTDHESRVGSVEGNVSTLQTQMSAQVAQPVLYAQSSAPTYNGNPSTQVWVDTT